MNKQIPHTPGWAVTCVTKDATAWFSEMVCVYDGRMKERNSVVLEMEISTVAVANSWGNPWSWARTLSCQYNNITHLFRLLKNSPKLSVQNFILIILSKHFSMMLKFLFFRISFLHFLLRLCDDMVGQGQTLITLQDLNKVIVTSWNYIMRVFKEYICCMHELW